MTRTLGSFNRRVNLARHRNDHAAIAAQPAPRHTQATLGYDLGLNRNTTGRQENTPTGAEKFVTGRNTAPRMTTGMRMAGEALNLNLGSAETRA